MAKRQSFEIIVAGAGPVGLLFAARLMRQQADVVIRIIDAGKPARWQAAEPDVRVYALSRESQWLFGELWPEIAARRISPYRRMRVFAGESPASRSAISFDAADIGEPDLGHIVEDNLLRTVLLNYLASVGVETSFGSAVDALTQRDGKVRLTTSDGLTLTTDLVVGADGADSKVRVAAGIDIVQKTYGQRALVTHVVTERPHAATAWQRFLPDGPLAFLPLSDGRSSIVWTNSEAEVERLLTLDEASFNNELQTASAGILGRLGPSGPRLAFSLQLKHATRYSGPGIALIGDAAHTVHPLAGQGMNLGLRDAAVLADTLIAARQAGEYPADDLVLRRYARAQRARNLGMQLAFDGLNELFGRRLPAWAAPLRDLGMAMVEQVEPAKRLLMRRALGVD